MSEPNPEIMLKIHELTEWSNKRITAYNNWPHQLNMLFDDIESGKFGSAAKTGSWYNWVKGIKEANPKPSNIPELEAQLQQLYDQDEV